LRRWDSGSALSAMASLNWMNAAAMFSLLHCSEAEVQSPEPASIAFVLCRVYMIETTFGDEKRWVPDGDSHFLIEQAISGLDDGLDVEDSMSSAAELLVAQREADEEQQHNSRRDSAPPASKAPRIIPKILPTNKAKDVGGKHGGKKV